MTDRVMCWQLREGRGHSLSREGRAQGFISGVMVGLARPSSDPDALPHSESAEEEVLDPCVY